MELVSGEGRCGLAIIGEAAVEGARAAGATGQWRCRGSTSRNAKNAALLHSPSTPQPIPASSMQYLCVPAVHPCFPLKLQEPARRSLEEVPDVLRLIAERLTTARELAIMQCVSRSCR
jgi:hypothetical protein